MADLQTTLNSTFVITEKDVETKRPQIGVVLDEAVRPFECSDSDNDHHSGNKHQTFSAKSNIRIVERSLKIKQRIIRTPSPHSAPSPDTPETSRRSGSPFAAIPLVIPQIVVSDYSDSPSRVHATPTEPKSSRDGNSFDQTPDLVKTTPKSGSSGSSSSSTRSRVICNCVEFFDHYAKQLTPDSKQTPNKHTKTKATPEINIKTIPCETKRCKCCSKSIIEYEQTKIFVSSSSAVDLFIEEFDQDQTSSASGSIKSSVGAIEPNNNGEPNQAESENDLNGVDNDYYFFSDLRRVSSPDGFYYLYVDPAKYLQIFSKRIIQLEPVNIDGELRNAIIFLTIPPCESDTTILNELFERNVPVDKKRVQCFIKLSENTLAKYAQYFIRASDKKLFFMRSIVLRGKFPVHEFRSNFNR